MAVTIWTLKLDAVSAGRQKQLWQPDPDTIGTQRCLIGAAMHVALRTPACRGTLYNVPILTLLCLPVIVPSQVHQPGKARTAPQACSAPCCRGTQALHHAAGEKQVTAIALLHNVILRVTDPPAKSKAAVLTSCMLIVLKFIPQLLHLVVVKVLCEHCTAVATGAPAPCSTALPIAGAATAGAPIAPPGCWPCSRTSSQ